MTWPAFFCRVKKLGLIQSRGLGDILIALPIARWYQRLGWDVVWPVDRPFAYMLTPAVDYVTFIPLDFKHDLNGFLYQPRELLQMARCDKVITLYSYLSGLPVALADQRLFRSLKFDEYKYAVAGVPFNEKWNLHLKRDHDREQRLFQRLIIEAGHTHGSYVVTHTLDDSIPELPRRYQRLTTLPLTKATDSLLDWLMILEHARHLVITDSCVANLVDQLRLPVSKTLILRSGCEFTPVFGTGWSYHGIQAGVELS
jgi:hypothetical protein